MTPTTTRQPADKYTDRMIVRLCEIYGESPHRILPEHRRNLWEWISRAMEAGTDIIDECKTYLSWLEHSIASKTNLAEQMPPRSARRAANDIGDHWPRANQWLKFRTTKKPQFNRKPSPYLRDDRDPEQIPTAEEWAEFITDLAAASAGTMTQNAKDMPQHP